MYSWQDRFIINGQEAEWSVLDFWQYAYSDLNSDPRDMVAEFLVSHSLGLSESINRQDWTVFDILYRNHQIEVKSTSYFQTWRKDGKVSLKRHFSIRQSQDDKKIVARHSVVYVFCILNGFTREEANALSIDNWDFYVAPTALINEKCGENKTISLGKVQKLSRKCSFLEIKEEIDRIIDDVEIRKEDHPQ